MGDVIKLINKIKESLKIEERLFENNKIAINEDVGKFLKTILPICILLFSSIFLLSIYTKPDIEFFILYASGAFLSLIFYFTILESKNYTLRIIVLYLYITFIFTLFTYIGAIANTDSHATSIVVFLCIFSFFILDKSHRVNSALIMYYLLFCLATFSVKPLGLAIEDVVNTTTFTIIGAILGRNYRRTKLIGFDTEREAKENQHMDFLTKLPNRRLLYLNIVENERSTTDPKITGVFMLDIDHFKIYNDSKGHIEGDICLQKISKLFNKIAKEYQVDIYRYGGEEFVGFYYGLDEEKFSNIVYQIAEEVRNLKISFTEIERKIITVSIGYTFKTVDSELTTNQLIDISDKALYEAKNSGRDNVKNL